LSSETKVTVKMPKNAQYSLNGGVRTGDITVFELEKNKSLNIAVEWNSKEPDYRNPHKAPLRTYRRIGGSGQERGTLLVDFINDSNYPTEIKYFESIPWILKMYLHTLKVVDENNSSGIFHLIVELKEILYAPAIDRERPNVLELVLILKPESTTKLSIDYEYAFVRYTEHHPDANYGFDIGYL
jgi:phosphatidylinositol glycan class T